MMFGPWEIPDTEYIESAQRLERGQSIPNDHIRLINKFRKTGRIMGSSNEWYTVSLDKCDCIDFERRGFPCKHMIRLALELNLSIDVPQFDPYAAAGFDVEDVISLLTERWEAGQLTLDALVKCSSALRKSSSMSKRKRGRPKKQT